MIDIKTPQELADWLHKEAGIAVEKGFDIAGKNLNLVADTITNQQQRIDELSATADNLHRVATVILDQLKRNEVTPAAIYDLEMLLCS